jgi:hypothetical protein
LKIHKEVPTSQSGELFKLIRYENMSIDQLDCVEKMNLLTADQLTSIYKKKACQSHNAKLAIPRNTTTPAPATNNDVNSSSKIESSSTTPAVSTVSTEGDPQ